MLKDAVVSKKLSKNTRDVCLAERGLEVDNLLDVRAGVQDLAELGQQLVAREHRLHLQLALVSTK